MRQSRDAHLKREAGNATQCLVDRQDFLRHGFRVADQQRAFGTACGVKLRPCSGRPSAFFPDLGERVRVARIKDFGGLLGGVGEKTDQVQSHLQLVDGVARA